MIRSLPFVAAVALLAAATSATAAGPSCELTFRIGTATPLFSASVFAIYQNAPGEFAGTGPNVGCTLLNNTIGAAADADQTRTLTLTASGTPTPINGPKDFARCIWTPTSRFPVASDFNLSGQSGFNTSFQPVNAQITISKIDCDGTIETTTTTTSSSTTTLPAPVCGDFNNDGTLQASDALAVLRAAVGVLGCDLCVCDLDGNSSKTATDALIALRVAVGIVFNTHCPICS
ncbi:MAG TPA: hypothetical protein VEC57_17755 [Candidatus Limnocylindrales bacterium]|nr:hypothetical protein [Candidatus Limnocylindrales bacterium]